VGLIDITSLSMDGGSWEAT